MTNSRVRTKKEVSLSPPKVVPLIKTKCEPLVIGGELCVPTLWYYYTQNKSCYSHELSGLIAVLSFVDLARPAKIADLAM